MFFTLPEPATQPPVPVPPPASHLPFTKLGLSVGQTQSPAVFFTLPEPATQSPVPVPVVVVVVAAAFSAAAAITAWFAASVPSPYIVAATLRRSCQDMLSPKNLPSATPQLVLFCSASGSTPPCSNQGFPFGLYKIETLSPSVKVRPCPLPSTESRTMPSPLSGLSIASGDPPVKTGCVLVAGSHPYPRANSSNQSCNTFFAAGFFSF